MLVMAVVAGGLYSALYTLDSRSPLFWMVAIVNVILVALLRRS